jgi:hypothetical protein
VNVTSSTRLATSVGLPGGVASRPKSPEFALSWWKRGQEVAVGVAPVAELGDQVARVEESVGLVTSVGR